MFIYSYFQKANNHKLTIFALAFGLLFFLNGCGIKSAELRAAEGSAAIIQPTTGHEVSRDIQDKQVGLTRTSHAYIRIKYEPINDYTTEDVYDELAAILEKRNWEVEKCNGCPSPSFRASLQQDDYPIPVSASVLIRSDENLVSIRIVHPRP